MNTALLLLQCGTFALTLAALVFSVAGLYLKRLVVFGRWTAAVASIVALVGFGFRWVVAGHPAIFGTFENTYTLAACLLVTSVLVGYMRPRWSELWRWAVPWASMSLLYGLRFPSGPVPLTISEQSLWVDVHVAFAWTALVALLGATTASLLRLAGRKPLGTESDETDRLVTECLVGGFLSFTAMLAIGSWYGFVLFGVFWQWSTVETLSLAVWLGYALLIHGRLFYGWSGRRLDAGVVLALPFTLAAYFIWSVLPDTWHFFDVPLMKPY